MLVLQLVPKSTVSLLPSWRYFTMGSPAAVLAARAERTPDKVFLLYEDKKITFAEFDAQATRYALALAALGLCKGDVAAIMMENRPEFLYAAMGLNRLGVTAALVNTNLTGPSLTHVLAGSGIKALIAGAECLSQVEPVLGQMPFGRGMVLFERSLKRSFKLPERTCDLNLLLDTSPALPAGVRLNPCKPGDWLVYIYTSGTTGLPKAGRCPNIRLTGAALAAGSLALACTARDTIYICLPLFHSNGFLIGFGSALMLGSKLALARKFSASRFWHDVCRHNATVFVYIGEICRYLLSQPPGEKDRGHRVRAAFGNGLRADVWRPFQDRFGIRNIYEFYASTEGNTALFNLDDKPGAVGKLGRFSSRVFNATIVKWDAITEAPLRASNGFCIPCADGEPGELLGRINDRVAATRFHGYTDAAATEKKIIRDVFRKGDRYFRSGDLLRRDRDGYVYFVDRIGDTFRWKGENVSTQEVADLLAAHPDIETANVYGVTVPHADGRAGMAAVTTRMGNEPDWRSLYASLNSLPEYAQPIFIRWVPAAELTATFKLQKTVLQQQGFDPAVTNDPIFLRDKNAATFRPLTTEEYRRIESGEIRIS